jgi:hypothetical protein
MHTNGNGSQLLGGAIPTGLVSIVTTTCNNVFNVFILPLRVAGLRLGPCSVLPGTRFFRELPIFSSRSSVWIPHLGPQSDSGHLDMSSCSTHSIPSLAYMHSHVRRSVLPGHLHLHRGRLPWQLHRRHAHGASRTQSCPPIQWPICSGRFRPNGHRTIHSPTTPWKAISSFSRNHFLPLTIM